MLTMRKMPYVWSGASPITSYPLHANVQERDFGTDVHNNLVVRFPLMLIDLADPDVLSNG